MMKKIWKWLRSDGLLHIESCALIAVACTVFLPWWAGGIIAMAVGVGKELWDKTHGGVCEAHDFICDGIGAVIGMLISLFWTL